MIRMVRLTLLAGLAAAAALALSACGQRIDVAQQYHHGAVLFNQRCGGCHTLRQAATHGSASNILIRQFNDGPNLSLRPETVTRVLYAIHNGGFSGAIMPQDIVTGKDAVAVARFVHQYAGCSGAEVPTPGLAGAQRGCPAHGGKF
jgi:mono/diheme cytochrome c family protein